MLISLCVLQSKYSKMKKQQIPPIGRNVLEIFCSHMYTGFLSNLHEKFHLHVLQMQNIKFEVFAVISF